MTDKREQAIKAQEAGMFAVDIDDLEDMYNETLTPAEFKGNFITSLNAVAEGIVKQSVGREVIADIKLTNSLNVNAFCRTEPANIEFNFALDAMLVIWIKSALGLYSAAVGSDNPYCRCLSQAELAKSMISVAIAIASQNIEPLRNASVLRCSCGPFFDPTLSTWVTLTELYIMLRGYAGIIQSNAEKRDDARERELRADLMAIEYLLEVGVERRDAVMYSTLFLEMIRMALIMQGKEENRDPPTYPSPESRIDKIMTTLPADTDPTSEVFAYCEMFNLLAPVLTKHSAELRKLGEAQRA